MPIKSTFLTFLLTFFVLLCNGKEDSHYRIRKVVIDAGHGGKDPGCHGIYSKEKDIALSIALKLGGYIEKNFENIDVIYTRKNDVFIPLDKRAKIANNAKVDLFISIHLNANNNKKAFGTETYVLGLHRSKENLEVAKRENSSILLEKNYQVSYNDFNPSSPESYITLTMQQNAHLDQSLLLANNVQNQFRERVSRKDRGVKQAGYLVLYKTTMPSILIEVGFLTNKEEENFLRSTISQDYIASAIYRAFKDYKFQSETRFYLPSVSAPKQNKKFIKKKDTVKKEVIKKPITKKKTIAVKKKVVKKDSPPPVVAIKKEVIKKPIVIDSNLVFKIQITSTSKKINLNDFEEYKQLKNVQYYFSGNLYKYVVGSAYTPEDSFKMKSDYEKKGLKGSFIVAFYKKKRISRLNAIKIFNLNQGNASED